MTIAELLLQDFDPEISNARRTLERVPESNPDWTPHARSMPIGRLAMHCANLPLVGAYVLEDDAMDKAAPRHPRAVTIFTNREDCLGRFDANSARCRAALATSPDDALTRLWRYTNGDQLIAELPRSLTFKQMCFNHLIHHTAQLGVYLRLNDIAVPALRGPSADEPWPPAR